MGSGSSTAMAADIAASDNAGLERALAALPDVQKMRVVAALAAAPSGAVEQLKAQAERPVDKALGERKK